MANPKIRQKKKASKSNSSAEEKPVKKKEPKISGKRARIAKKNRTDSLDTKTVLSKTIAQAIEVSEQRNLIENFSVDVNLPKVSNFELSENGEHLNIELKESVKLSFYEQYERPNIGRNHRFYPEGLFVVKQRNDLLYIAAIFLIIAVSLVTILFSEK